MRGHGFVVTAACLLLLSTASPVSAAPVPAPSGVPGTAVCSLATVGPSAPAAQSGLTGLTGLVTTPSGYAVINGQRAGTSGSSYLHVFLLDNECHKTRTLNYTADTTPQDPQDLARSADGAFWVADTGDSTTPPERTKVAVWKIPADGARAIVYRFRYPDNAAYNVQALLLAGDGTPVLVTRTATGPASLFVPAAPPSATATVPLKKAGEFTPQRTYTANNFAASGNILVTGGATSPDGRKAVLRTLSDAYEWDVNGGDVVTAITGGTPRITRLPDEAQGSAIAYSADGTRLITVSNITENAISPLLSYAPTTPAAARQAAAAAAAATAPEGGITAWFKALTLEQLTYLVGAVGMLGLNMVLGGVAGIQGARRRQRRTDRAAARAARAQADEDPDPAGYPDPGGYPDAAGYSGEPGRPGTADMPAAPWNPAWDPASEAPTATIPPVPADHPVARAAVPGQSGYDEQRRGGPRQGGSRPGDPRRGDPRRADPRRADSRRADPRRADPRRDEASYGERRQDGPKRPPRAGPPARLAGAAPHPGPPAEPWPDSPPPSRPSVEPPPPPPARSPSPLPPQPGAAPRRPHPGPGVGRPPRAKPGTATGRVLPPPAPPFDYSPEPEDYGD